MTDSLDRLRRALRTGARPNARAAAREWAPEMTHRRESPSILSVADNLSKEGRDSGSSELDGNRLALQRPLANNLAG
jgi:hypothetical protein